MPHQHEKINYLEFPSTNLQTTKQFFTAVFDWSFTDYGEAYTAFSNAGIDGGFFSINNSQVMSTKKGSALVVFYSGDLDATQNKIEENNGEIVEKTFPFPGGRRFHFSDPSGNEFAVWSDQ
jgi:predicted enzyme related to lactoylglutathione lyase